MALDFLTGCFGWQPDRLSRRDERKTRALIWIFKFMSIVPIALAAFFARESYLYIQEHPELSQHPYNKNVQLAFFATYLGCILAFPWIFISSLLLFKWHGQWILLYGIVELGLASLITVGVAMQAQFLPSTTHGCEGNKVESWQIAEGLSFFTRIAQFDQGNAVSATALTKTAEEVCKRMVTNWGIAVLSLFLQVVVAYISIFSDGREYSILNPIRPFFWFILLFVYCPFYLIHFIVTPWTRLWASYFKKAIRRMRGMKDLDIPQPTRFEPQYQQFDLPKTKLMDIFVIEHVLLNVVDYIHYEDVVNLSLTSRAVREVVYPAHDLDHRIPKLKSRACRIEQHRHCLYCNKKVCWECNSWGLRPGLPGRRHVTQCKPFCKPCYFKHHAHPRHYKRPCKCHSTDRSHEFQDICRTCATKDHTELQDARQKRYEQQARNIAFAEGARCGQCMKVLKCGTRWWVCGKCGGECRDRIHPGYVGKTKERDVEKGEGEGEDGGVGRWWRRWGLL